MKKIIIKSILAGIVTLSANNTLAESVPNTGLGVNFESAQIVGSGRSIHVFRVPVENEQNNTIQYYDATFVFTTDENGALTFENFRNILVSPELPKSTTNIIDGTYRDINGAELIIESIGVVNGAVHKRIYEPKSESRPYEGTWAESDASIDPLNLFSEAVQETLSDDWVYGKKTGSSNGSFYQLGNGNVLFAIQQLGDRLTMRVLNSNGSELYKYLLEKVK